MPAVIDSAPDCIVSEQVDGTDEASVTASGEDSLDFILQDNYADCAGIMTFGPGTVYGEGGEGANGAYYALVWIGIFVMIAVLVAWVVMENRRLANYVKSKTSG